MIPFFCFFSRTEHIPKRWLHRSCQAVIFVYHYMLLQLFVLTIHCTRGAVEDSFLSSLYPSMLSVFSSPPSCWFLSPPSSSPPPSPPCPPSFHCCSGPALSLVPRIQATHTHKQFWVTLWEYTSTQLGSKLSANTHTHTPLHTHTHKHTHKHSWAHPQSLHTPAQSHINTQLDYLQLDGDCGIVLLFFDVLRNQKFRLEKWQLLNV